MGIFCFQLQEGMRYKRINAADQQDVPRGVGQGRKNILCRATGVILLDAGGIAGSGETGAEAAHMGTENGAEANLQQHEIRPAAHDQYAADQHDKRTDDNRP